jgi:hypothetical protein
VDDNEAFQRIAIDFLHRHHDLNVVGGICEKALALVRNLELWEFRVA